MKVPPMEMTSSSGCADEFCADDLAFLLRVGNAGEFIQEAVHCIDVDQVGAKFVAKYAYYLLGLAFTQEAVVDVDRYQLLAYGFDQQGRDDRGVNAAREGQEHFFVSDLGTEFFDLFVDEFFGQGRSGDSLHVGRAYVSSSHN